MAATKGLVLPAERLGKHKTSWQIVTVVFFLLLLAVQELHYAGADTAWWLRAWNDGGQVLVWLTVVLTVYSGLAYAWANRAVVVTDR